MASSLRQEPFLRSVTRTLDSLGKASRVPDSHGEEPGVHGFVHDRRRKRLGPGVGA